MNNYIRLVLGEIANGDMKRARKATIDFLRNNKTQKDKAFCESMIAELEKKLNFTQLPEYLKGMLILENVSDYPVGKIMWRDEDKEIANKVISMYYVAERMERFGIKYLPSAILYGESGCGKTELARYMAYKAKLPYVYVRFSYLIDSHLGNTQKNLARIFDFMKSEPCLICFDEIDAIGLKRGQTQKVGEMARIVIALMQELDSLKNNSIVIATTNRFDMLDSALVRRFQIQYEMKRMQKDDARRMASKFLEYAGINGSEASDCLVSIIGAMPSSEIVRHCTEFIASKMLKEEYEEKG